MLGRLNCALRIVCPSIKALFNKVEIFRYNPTMNDNNIPDDLESESFAKGKPTSDLQSEQEQEFVEREVDLSQLDSPEFQLVQAKMQLAEAQQNYLRSLADLENVKKRAAKDRSDLLKYQGERVIIDLLEVMDNLDLAVAQKETTLEDLQTGLSLIHKKFNEILVKWGVVSNDTLGQQFDPQIQEALSLIPDPTSQPNTVIQEIRKSYTYKDKLIRPGQVIVSKEAE